MGWLCCCDGTPQMLWAAQSERCGSVVFAGVGRSAWGETTENGKASSSVLAGCASKDSTGGAVRPPASQEQRVELERVQRAAGAPRARPPPPLGLGPRPPSATAPRAMRDPRGGAGRRRGGGGGRGRPCRALEPLRRWRGWRGWRPWGRRPRRPTPRRGSSPPGRPRSASPGPVGDTWRRWVGWVSKRMGWHGRPSARSRSRAQRRRMRTRFRQPARRAGGGPQRQLPAHLGGEDPHAHDGQQDHAQVRRGRRKAAKADDHELLDQRAARLAQRVADHVNGGLALGLRVAWQRGGGGRVR